ncbi:MAG: hypothetical protein E7311_04655 [Clostridiales bacterium]|nr:hypothetical protein [Clostridiales bacterium]
MKKGISLVALIITIIVLIILTAAVIWSSGDSPEQAKLAVFYNDISVIQEAVTTKTLTNYVDVAIANLGETSATAKWTDILSNDPVTGKNVNAAVPDVDLYAFKTGAGVKLGLGLTDEKMSEFCVDPETSTVYHIRGVKATLNDAETALFNRSTTSTTDTILEAALPITSYSLGNNNAATLTDTVYGAE